MSRLLKRYAEIETIKNRLLQKAEKLTVEELNHSPSEGKWSAGQVLFHTYYSESGTIKVIQKNLAEKKTDRKSDLGGTLRNLLLMGFLRSPMKFKAPAVASKVPESITLDEVKSLFEKNNNEFKKILQELPDELHDKYIFKHPISGLFTINQTLNFVREHYLHHEPQLDNRIK